MRVDHSRDILKKTLGVANKNSEDVLAK